MNYISLSTILEDSSPSPSTSSSTPSSTPAAVGIKGGRIPEPMPLMKSVDDESKRKYELFGNSISYKIPIKIKWRNSLSHPFKTIYVPITKREQLDRINSATTADMIKSCMYVRWEDVKQAAEDGCAITKNRKKFKTTDEMKQFSPIGHIVAFRASEFEAVRSSESWRKRLCEQCRRKANFLTPEDEKCRNCTPPPCSSRVLKMMDMLWPEDELILALVPSLHYYNWFSGSENSMALNFMDQLTSSPTTPLAPDDLKRERIMASGEGREEKKITGEGREEKKMTGEGKEKKTTEPVLDKDRDAVEIEMIRKMEVESKERWTGRSRESSYIETTDSKSKYCTGCHRQGHSVQNCQQYRRMMMGHRSKQYISAKGMPQTWFRRPIKDEFKDEFADPSVPFYFYPSMTGFFVKKNTIDDKKVESKEQKMKREEEWKMEEQRRLEQEIKESEENTTEVEDNNNNDSALYMDVSE